LEPKWNATITKQQSYNDIPSSYCRHNKEQGFNALLHDRVLARGLNCYQGKSTYEAVGKAFDREGTPLAEVLGK